jgi:STE24 endopeptidase
MRRRPLVLLPVVFLLVLLVAAPALGASPGPREGSVVVRDHIGDDDRVQVWFPAGEPPARAEAAVRAAASKAGIPARDVSSEIGESSGLLVVTLETSVSRRTGTLSRTVPARVLGAFPGLAGDGEVPVVLRLERGATTGHGAGRVVDTDPLSSDVELAGSGDVAWRVAPGWLWSRLAGVALLFLVPFVLLRLWAGRVAAGRGEEADKVHRLRRMTTAVSLASVLVLPLVVVTGTLVLPELVLGVVAPAASRSAWLAQPVRIVLFGAMILLPTIAAAAAAAPAYRRVRGIARDRRESRRQGLRRTLLFLPMLLWVLVVNGLSGVADLSLPLYLGLLVVLLAGFFALLPVVMMRGLDAHEPDPATAGRLLDLARRQGLRVRGVRVMRARRQKVANAAIVGLFPRLRYIVVSDHLLDTFEPDEVDAVLAHEVGHGKRHHLPIRVGAWLGALALLYAAGFGVGWLLDRLAPGVDPFWLVLAYPLLIPLVMLVVQGAVGLRQERAADAYGADLVGLDPMVRALEKLAEVNAARRRTGRLWDLLQQHPGIQERVEHLEARRAAAAGTS